MKQLAIVTFILSVCATSVHAEAQKPVIFNGMVFDAPPTQGGEAPQATHQGENVASSQEAHRPQEFGVVKPARGDPVIA